MPDIAGADAPRRRGPEPERLKIEGMDWEEAVRWSFQVKKPADGWPDTVKKPPTKKRGPK